MSNEEAGAQAAPGPPEPPPEAAPVRVERAPGPRPYVTYAVIALCVVVFLLFILPGQPFPALSDALAPDGVQVWHGAVWGLLTSAFVHVAFLHLLFNLLWARDLGSLLEPDMGTIRYLGFILAAAVVSSGWQLLVSDGTGIGYSGVVYALFGYVLGRRGSRPAYDAMLSRTVGWMLGWLVLCIVLTWTGAWRVGNGAHVAGLAFGFLVGSALERPAWRKPAIALVGLMLVGVVLSCAYMPWSDAWQQRVVFRQIELQRRAAQAGDPDAQWRHGSMLMAWTETRSEGLEWLRKSAEAGNPHGMNGLAWFLAVAREDKLRDGDQAVKWGEKAYRAQSIPEYADTLAAAYAEVERWDDAIATQEGAIAGIPADQRKPYAERLELYKKREKYRE
jgi:membrane associated rhomboid family serine protease